MLTLEKSSRRDKSNSLVPVYPIVNLKELGKPTKGLSTAVRYTVHIEYILLIFGWAYYTFCILKFPFEIKLFRSDSYKHTLYYMWLFFPRESRRLKRMVSPVEHPAEHSISSCAKIHYQAVIANTTTSYGGSHPCRHKHAWRPLQWVLFTTPILT